MVNTFVIVFVGGSQELAANIKQELLANVEYADSEPAEIYFEGWQVFAFTTWPEAEAFLPNVIDAVIVDLAAEDVGAFKEYFKRFEHVIHKLAPLHSEAEAPLAAELKLSITFNPQVEDFLPHLLKLDTELMQLISQEFTTFDRDSSGFIDLQELKDISRQLGQELSDVELETALSELDLNQDGKISLEEFTQWWKSGRKGQNRTMRRLTRDVARVKHLLNHAHAEIVKLTEVEEEAKYVDIDLSIGNEADVTPNFGFKLDAFNSENEARTQANSKVDSADYYVLIAIKSPNPATSAQAFQEAYTSISAALAQAHPEVAMALGFINVSTSSDDQKAYIAITSLFTESFATELLKFRPLLFPQHPQHISLSFLSDFEFSKCLDQVFYSSTSLHLSAKISEQLQSFYLSIIESQDSGSSYEEAVGSGLLGLLQATEFKLSFRKADQGAFPLPENIRSLLYYLPHQISVTKFALQQQQFVPQIVKLLETHVDASEISITVAADILTLAGRVYGRNIGVLLGRDLTSQELNDIAHQSYSSFN
jgi:hypothetical protein